ncbi:L,D-transpeptidase [Cyanobium sp. CH-040]|uniref:L,D-transpeptidase n=1 Tax=Cyanobium sp. CH-040 TaxID=2823708 RepID=UPI0020CB7F44|nr:L,D-transpeptidase [Cyanobium sp. CH-040]
MNREPTQGASAATEPIKITLDLSDPSMSFGVLTRGEDRTVFQVGFGRNGITCAGSRFEEGYTPLGRFKVNAILSNDRFVMEPALIAQSGRTEQELKATLFRNMNAIDFSGDGQTGEYGIGYVSLAPVDSVEQPFAFNTYDGRFRWYSFAIHGSNNDQRIGQQVTGGCLNVAEPVLKTLLETVRLGDEVVISAQGPCTP